jgi:membrane protein YdbS with pleckstrin-like domain
MSKIKQNDMEDQTHKPTVLRVLFFLLVIAGLTVGIVCIPFMLYAEIVADYQVLFIAIVAVFILCIVALFTKGTFIHSWSWVAKNKN